MTPRPVICVAPDKFKGTLSAAEATSIIALTLSRAMPQADIRQYPMADGGEGTAATIAGYRGWDKCIIDCCDAMMRPAAGEYFISPEGTEAIIDSSAVIGLQMLGEDERDVMSATSYPLGVVIREIINLGVRHITICIGGTATCDGGAGMLQALGYKFLDYERQLIATPITPGLLSNIAEVIPPEPSILNFLSDSIRALSDVAVPLLSANANLASVLSFAPQKNHRPLDMAALEDSIRHFRDVIAPDCQCASDMHGGAGGGIGYAIESILHATVTSGAEEVIRLSGIFDDRPSLVVTGEGCVDDTSFVGKVVGALLEECQHRSIPMAILAGISRLTDNLPHGVMALESTFPPPTHLPAPKEAKANLQSACIKLANRL